MFVCLPVCNLARSMQFSAKLGFRFHRRITDGCAACVIVNRNAYAILLDAASWRDAPLEPREFSGIVGVSCQSRREVDDIRAMAISASGSAYRPVLDLGSLYSATFRDPDGYIWEAVWAHLDEDNVRLIL